MRTGGRRRRAAEALPGDGAGVGEEGGARRNSPRRPAAACYLFVRKKV
jgi:hypothetical protein